MTRWNVTLPSDASARKGIPLYSGLIQYFPAALAKVAEHSVKGNRQHNPGCELFHDRSKSGDELDALVRHLFDDDLVSVAWRALSALQKRCEALGAPIAPAARNYPEDNARKLRDDAIAHGIAWDRPLVTDVFVQREHAAGGFMFAPERD
ncbi:MAG: hypothetical protein JSR70_07640 [Proteobacteria bacterium]|nr:hypothetical protein [Pseudomonadota bacterium]